MTFQSERTHCHCGERLRVLKTHRRTVATLTIGAFHAHETLLHCAGCKKVFVSDELQQMVASGSCFGYDVLVDIGLAMFVKCRNEGEIQAHLKKQNISISIREIGFLAKRFIVYLALAHHQSRFAIKAFLLRQGGYVLHLDGTCEGDSPHLMSVLDGIAKIVLGNVKLPSEKAEQIVPFLKRIQLDYGNPIAMVHDMGRGISEAVTSVFPDIPDFICHYHFLRDIGKDLFEGEYKLLRNALKKHRVRTSLRQKLQWVTLLIEQDDDLKRMLDDWHKNGKRWPIGQGHLPPTLSAYMLIWWIRDAGSELDGYGFPFDRAHLVFYRRLQGVVETLKNLEKAAVKSKPLLQLQRILAPVLNDKGLKKQVDKMQEKVNCFENLRQAMRIARPTGKQGLNDNGTEVNMKTIKEKVMAFRNAKDFKKRVKADETYRKMATQIDRYRDKLFADPMSVHTSTGQKIIQPQRTNNLLEQLFRDIKKRSRKKSGSRTLNKTLKSMIADTPLVKNLENQEYVKIILDGKKDLAQRFAEIDIQLVRQEQKNNDNQRNRLPANMKKVLRMPGFMQKLVEFTVKKDAA